MIARNSPSNIHPNRFHGVGTEETPVHVTRSHKAANQMNRKQGKRTTKRGKGKTKIIAHTCTARTNLPFVPIACACIDDSFPLSQSHSFYLSQSPDPIRTPFASTRARTHRHTFAHVFSRCNEILSNYPSDHVSSLASQSTPPNLTGPVTVVLQVSFPIELKGAKQVERVHQASQGNASSIDELVILSIVARVNLRTIRRNTTFNRHTHLAISVSTLLLVTVASKGVVRGAKVRRSARRR